MKTAAQREEANLEASMAWARTGGRCRVAGIAEMIRSKPGKPRSGDARRAAQLRHKIALRERYNHSGRAASDRFAAQMARLVALLPTGKRPRHPLDRSRYFPHQSAREINRRKENAHA